ARNRVMKQVSWQVLCVAGVLGSGQSPPPTGPASEATTPEVDVTMPDDATPAATGDKAPTTP
ncbi:MAG: hypothetical protein AB7O38_15955, partial [Pirellulaceae bacterium]